MTRAESAIEDRTYTEWMRGEGLEIADPAQLPNLNEAALRPWARRGGSGACFFQPGTRAPSDCYVCDIPAGKQVAPQRQLYEEVIVVLAGRGATSVWNGAGQKASFEWKAGSVFAVPLNAWHQHFNGSGLRTARLAVITNAPAIMRVLGDARFVFGSEHEFKDRFSGAPDFFANAGERHGALIDTSLVADAINLPLGKSDRLLFSMAKGAMVTEIVQLAPGGLREGAVPGPGAHMIVLAGEGYSLFGTDEKNMTRCDWRAGTLVVPPIAGRQQHVNTGTGPARYIMLNSATIDDSGPH